MSEEKKKVASSDAKEEKKPAAKKAAPVKKAADSAKKEAAKSEKKPAAKPKAKKEASPKKKADVGVKKQGKLIEDVRLYDVIERPIVTEKSTLAAEQNKVVFAIRPAVTKQDVKRAVEALFGVKVTKVNTILTNGKRKRFRGRAGQRSDQRKAIVTLAQGQSIDLAAGLK